MYSLLCYILTCKEWSIEKLGKILCYKPLNLIFINFWF